MTPTERLATAAIDMMTEMSAQAGECVMCRIGHFRICEDTMEGAVDEG